MAFTRFGSKQKAAVPQEPEADDRPTMPGRHRGEPSAEPDVSDVDAPDTELESYLAALAPESGPETTESGRRFGEAQVLQLRFNLIATDELKRHAQARGISPQALAQEWILERLSWEAQVASSNQP